MPKQTVRTWKMLVLEYISETRLIPTARGTNLRVRESPQCRVRSSSDSKAMPLVTTWESWSKKNFSSDWEAVDGKENRAQVGNP